MLVLSYFLFGINISSFVAGRHGFCSVLRQDFLIPPSSDRFSVELGYRYRDISYYSVTRLQWDADHLLLRYRMLHLKLIIMKSCILIFMLKRCKLVTCLDGLMLRKNLTIGYLWDESNLNFRFEVLTAMRMMIMFFYILAPCRFADRC